ncbi:MAG: hypothetical protein Q7S71_02665 [Candidatus Nitrotoga sp.]|nr:hypothetical protein [Candidatus Nitrotoga sp.]
MFKAPEINEIKVKHEAISKHLLNMIPGCKVRHKHDFDEDAVVFYVEISGIIKKFTISDQYLQDYTAIEIFDFIKQNEVIKIISTHGKVKISTREGYPVINYR